MFRKILNSSLNSNRCKENYKILWIIERNMRNLPYSEVFAIFVLGYLINVTITVNTMDPNHFVSRGTMFVGDQNVRGGVISMVTHEHWSPTNSDDVTLILSFAENISKVSFTCLSWRRLFVEFLSFVYIGELAKQCLIHTYIRIHNIHNHT